MNKEQIRAELAAKAEQLLGKSRAGELASDIERTAAELASIHEYPLSIEDEL